MRNGFYKGGWCYDERHFNLNNVWKLLKQFKKNSIKKVQKIIQPISVHLIIVGNL